MRDLKFRVWDGKDFLDGDDILQGFINVIEGVLTVELESPNSETHIEQYTGLKDSEGKEIYEGDIVRTGFRPLNLEIISFKNGNWSYSYSLDEYGDKPDTEWEVIGNIHENPELLNEQV